MSVHQIHLTGGAENETATFIEQMAGDACLLICEYQGKRIEGKASDYFAALCSIRIELEKAGLTPVCYGASLNVYPSGMARDMGQGKVAYKMQLGRHATKEDLVRIFETGPDFVPSTVAQQRNYFNEWVRSARV